MEIKEFICIGCPVGCELIVRKINNDLKVTGNQCKIGEKYGEEEFVLPKRIVTLGLKTNINGEKKMISVKTTNPIPKEEIFNLIKEVKKININKIVEVGEILVKNILNTNSDIVVTFSNGNTCLTK